MARHLILLRFGFLAGACLAGAAGGQGQPAADPTRPPAHFTSPRAAGASAASGPVLQSVLISGTRKSAIISGERVELGGTFAGARLTALREAEAVLEGPEGRTVLRLVPDVTREPSVQRKVDHR